MSIHPTISSSKVEGTSVYNLAGEKLGAIDDLIIDKRNGHVRYASLAFGGFLGMGTDRYPLPWSLLTYDVEKDGYVVNLDMAQLKDAPHHAKEQAPAYSDDYGRGVYAHYGTPWPV
ncbi:PRC-barrel domain-containing protein [Roseateles sp.]|uniref:PRC-barrel domain-containing protein n=1 Tax=Roseateles sp. TaxID=1971397 RepID=UPI003BAC02DB